jgi:hypothetical protein
MWIEAVFAVFALFLLAAFFPFFALFAAVAHGDALPSKIILDPGLKAQSISSFFRRLKAAALSVYDCQMSQFEEEGWLRRMVRSIPPMPR